MNKQKEKVPDLRFKGFTDDWEQRKLGDVGKTQSGIGFPNKEQGGKKGVPFFKVSDMNNKGNEFEMISSNNYVTESQIDNKKWKPISNVPAVIFAKVGAALMLNRKRLVKVPFLIDNNTMAYIFNDEWDSYFGKVLFDTINLPKYAQTGALPSFNGSDIQNITVMLPSKDEQQRISQFFKVINKLITLHQRKLVLLKQLKKGLLQKMFADKGSKRPILRFNGFTDDWEQRKLGEIGIIKSGIGFPTSQQGGAEGTPFYKVSDMNKPGNELVMKSSSNYVSNSQINDNHWKPIEKTPAVIFAKVGAALMLNRKRLVNQSFLIDNNTMSYSFSNSWDTIFGYTLFLTLNLPKYAQTGALPSFNAKDIQNIKVSLPLKNEQHAIGELMAKVSNIVTLQQRKQNYLKLLKNSLLQQMFM